MNYIVSMMNADGSYTNLGEPVADREVAESLAAKASSGGGADVAVLEDSGGQRLVEVARYADGRKLEPSEDREQVMVAVRKPTAN